MLIEGLGKPSSSGLLADSPRTFLCKLFPSGSLEALLGARESLRHHHMLDDDLAFLILSKALDLSSHSQTDGIYKAPTSRKTAIDPSRAVRVIAETVRDDLHALAGSSYADLVSIHGHSAATMHEVGDDAIDIVVTSPPYLNNFDYAEMTRMLLYFWGMATSWGDITDKVRSRLIVNTTTALRGHKSGQDQYRDNIPHILHPELSALVSDLQEQRRTRSGKKEYDYLIYPYFSQITDVLRQCHRCMKPGAPIHIMIADAALYGIHISTPQLFQDILTAIGFSDSKCILVRRRGHRWLLKKRSGSKIGLGEYHVQAYK